MFLRPLLLAVSLCVAAPAFTALAQKPTELPREQIPPPFDRYMERRVAELSAADWQAPITRENWPETQAKMRRDLQRMLGLDPWPARGDLRPVVTGTVQGDGYVVEKLHFQSLPGLFVTGNLYLPAQAPEPAPAILYVCGHANVIENGVSLGNKTGYQHHGAWFARHGYVCLIIDTIQLGEIRGEHHGTYAQGKWWWASRGYTPAGVEAWNGIRALDYLQTRPEVDAARIGITGRSGGGAYSWWIAALDDRIKVAVPTAGITTLKNHVLDGAIEGHCDCMFMVNTERWDFDRVAALVAPRPLLIANTDSDTIFPLDGVMEIFNRTRALYRRLGKEDHIGIHITEGPHKDTQPLNTGAFHWLNRFLKGADRMDLLDEPATKRHQARELRVFTALPADENVTTVDDFFVPRAKPFAAPESAEAWAQYRDSTMKALRGECFRAWPQAGGDLALVSRSSTAEGVRLTVVEFTSEESLHQTLWLLHRADVKPEDLDLVVVNVLDDESWAEFRASGAVLFPAEFPGAEPSAAAFAQERRMLTSTKWAMAYTCPRGTGPQSWAALPAKKRLHLQRRLLLMGESLESGQVWDIQRAVAAAHATPGFARVPVWLQSQKTMAANTLYASLFVSGVKRLDLHGLPLSHRDGPTFLNVLKHADLPAALALAAERSTVALYSADAAPWEAALATARALDWGEKRIQLRAPMDAAAPPSR